MTKTHVKLLGTGFYNAWVHICCTETKLGAFTRRLKPNHPLSLPVAHGERRFQLSEDLWLAMQKQGCSSLHYCDAAGQIVSHFPINPNSSAYNLAALTNARGNVMAIMPHPERSPEGDILFQSMHDYIKDGHYPAFHSIDYYHVVTKPKFYPYTPKANELIVAPLTTDNQALTVEKTLHNQGIKVSVKRYTHWEISCSPASFKQISEQGLLFNPIKEEWIKNLSPKGTTSALLIQAQEDLIGQHKVHQLKQRMHHVNIEALRYGVLWLIDCEQENPEQVIDYLQTSSLLFNPHSDFCFYYGH